MGVYCDAAGISMGRAIVTLIERELMIVFGESTGESVPVLVGRAEEQLAARKSQVAVREREVKVAEDRLRRWTERLRLAEAELGARERRAELASKLAARPGEAIEKVGRNERCPCGSGSKYKHCHGAASR